MLLSELLAAAEVQTLSRRSDAEVTSVEADSRLCRAGSCFVAVRGWREDGHKYIRAAAEAGSVAVVCEDAAGVPASTACAVVADTREAVGRLSQAIRGWPARRVVTIGVSGTNGKSTVVHLVRAILQSAGHRPALLGTIRYETGRRSLRAHTTTPGAVELAEMSAEMVAAGRTHLVMEVSSHALDQRRTAGIDFRAAVFTNLSRDHLDYHVTPGAYRAAKLRLFERLSPDAAAIINRDDLAGEAFARATRAKVHFYGLSPAADLRARIERIDTGGTGFSLIYGGRELPATTTLIGRHNVYNCLAAAGACAALGIDLPTIISALGKVGTVPGRLQRVEVEAPYRVFVDYAHTDDALKNVLGSLLPIKRGRIIVVFGCGGDRDRGKRPQMARVAEELADHIVVTSDNPRSEEPRAIIEQILSGLSEAGRMKTDVEADRRRAIELAIGKARDGDIVLIAGKGHEDYQVIGSERIHFDDVEAAVELMRREQSG